MKIGILTFYCSDNYGAMLQAYGLKNFVQKINSDVEIVPYAPYYLVGRHWFIPYYPFKSIRERVMWTLVGIKHNLQMKGANSHISRSAGSHFPASQDHIKRPVLKSGRVGCLRLRVYDSLKSLTLKMERSLFGY